jgi:carbonic anhydrase
MVNRLCSFVVMTASVSMFAPASVYAEGEHHWSYRGSTGPAKWGTLESDYKECSVDKMQSPIDISDADAKKGELPLITFDYTQSPLKIIDNGHSVQIDYAPGSSITVAGKQYELVQFHFHRPSEEKINGKTTTWLPTSYIRTGRASGGSARYIRVWGQLSNRVATIQSPGSP